MFRVEGLTVRFGGLVAVDDVSFNVQQNTIVSIIGPNGAGKTTTFNAISGYAPIHKGQIYLNDKDITKTPTHKIAEQGIGRTFQKETLFGEMTVLENVITAAHLNFKSGLWRTLINSPFLKQEEKTAAEKALEILQFCGLSKLKDNLAKNLSYGDGRRLEIAIALSMQPKLLLLDEPAAGLNPGETHQMTALISKVKEKGITIILVEHDMSVVMSISDYIYVLSFGRKIAEGKPEEVRNNDEVIEAYLGSKQFIDS
jgi:branched-chain amino acid transport system ATP-binding protein